MYFSCAQSFPGSHGTAEKARRTGNYKPWEITRKAGEHGKIGRKAGTRTTQRINRKAEEIGRTLIKARGFVA